MDLPPIADQRPDTATPEEDGAPDALLAAFTRLKAAAALQPYPPLEQRQRHLLALERAILARKADLVAAVDADFGGRLAHETLFAEIFVTVEALRHARRHLARWARRRRRPVPLALQPGRAWVQPQPLGVVGVIAPWNYPVQLALAPLAGILAAGNRVLLKPSELTPRTTALLERIVADSLPDDVAALVSGGAEVGGRFAALALDHLLFTGSTRVGRLVMQAASANLTPVTLELGGKSPAVLLPDADVASAAVDIAYGKFTNAGQTCVAADYVLLPRPLLAPFLDALRQAVAAQFPTRDGAAEMSVLLGEGGRARAHRLLDEARDAGCRIETLAPPPRPGHVAPSAVIDPDPSLSLMREEIFAPLLPLIPYETVDDAIRHIADGERPLALYLFGKDGAVVDAVLRRTHAGGVAVNDTLVQVAVEDLPFGGVGASGIGCYHGRDGFDRFSHLKPVFQRGAPRLDRLVRPPLRRLHHLILRALLRG